MPPAPVDLLIADGTLVDAAAEYPRTSVAITGGRVVAIGDSSVLPAARQTVDATGQYVLPGLVDAHVHLREPGMAYKEGYSAGTGAAALGGVTCVLDMPNTEPPTNTARRLADKRALVRGRSWVDYGLYGLLGPGDCDNLTELVRAGAVGIKAFLGQSESGPGCPLPPDDGELYEAMATLAALGVRLAVHAENHAIMHRRLARLKDSAAAGLDAHRQSRPPVVEVEAIRRAGVLARYAGCAIHVVHVSSAAGAAEVRRVRAEGVDITAETCPHYLVFPAGPDSDRPLLRVNPPIRDEDDRVALARELRAGGLQFVASDHAPHDAAEKRGRDIWQIRPGVIGVQHTLQLLWHRRAELGLSLPDLVRLTSTEPARTWGLRPRKGGLFPGSDGDLVVVDPARLWVIDTGTTYSRHDTSPYTGLRGVGAPSVTVLRGSIVARDGRLTGRPAGVFVPGAAAEPGGASVPGDLSGDRAVGG